MVFTTSPAVFLLGFVGMSSLVKMLTPFVFFFVKVISSKKAFTANPNTSNPGPKFAVEEGATTVIFEAI